MIVALVSSNGSKRFAICAERFAAKAHLTRWGEKGGHAWVPQGIASLWPISQQAPEHAEFTLYCMRCKGIVQLNVAVPPYLTL